MRLNIAIPEEHVTKEVLDGALETVTRLNEQLIKAGAAPTSYQLLEQGARWKPEPPGQEHFDHGGIIAARGWGDCDDWGPLHAATLRVTGRDPGARSVARKSGPKRWHATTVLSNGREDDPSVKAGMPSATRSVGARGAWLPIMFPRVNGINGAYIATPQLALRPVPARDGQVEAWQARVDLPWHYGPPSANPRDVAMVSLHRSPVSSQAIVGAVRGAFRLGLANADAVDPDNLRRLSALAEACEGAPWEQLAERYGEEHANAASQIVGSFFGKALRGLGKVAKKAVRVATPAINLIPGGSLATAAFNAASPGVKRSVLTQAHKPPAARAPVPVRAVQLQRAPAAAPRPAGPPAPAGGNWLPYPYPVPYPVPGWSGGAAAGPGEAWPPRG